MPRSMDGLFSEDMDNIIVLDFNIMSTRSLVEF